MSSIQSRRVAFAARRQLAALRMSVLAEPPADIAVLDLIERYRAAEAEHVRLGELAAEMVDNHTREHPKPEVMRIRAADRALGLPQPASPKTTFYCLPFDVDALRKPRWQGTTRFVARTPEARARADEIVQAFEEWWLVAVASKKYKAIRGLPSVELRMAAAGRLIRRLRDQIAQFSVVVS
jgi:hypothetical protein